MSTNAIQPSAQPKAVGESREALILFSHGSLLCGAGQPLERHAERLRATGEFARVEVGYLNYSEPTFESAAAAIASAGVSRIVVVPFFLAPGYFVTTSLPKLIADVQPRFPNLSFRVADPIGADKLLADALLRCAAEARPPLLWRQGLVNAVQHCRMRVDCPIYGQYGCNGSTEPNSPPVGNRDSGPCVDSANCALLVMVHGSPKAEANDPMLEVVEMVRSRGLFQRVEVGFMECNQPTIPDAIDACAELSPAWIVALPYFLHTGTHVASDLPDLLDDGRVRYPHIEFVMGEFLGNDRLIADILAKRAR